MLCRYYGFSLKDTMSLTIRQFVMLLREVNVLVKMEFGSAVETKGFSASAQHKLAMSQQRTKDRSK